jgi:hypothetical protein
MCCSANQLADLFEEYDGTADRKRRRAARAAAQVRDRDIRGYMTTQQAI